MADPTAQTGASNGAAPAAPRLRLFAYDLLLACGLLLASPWLLLRVATRPRYRSGLAERLALSLPPRRGRRARAWIHAGSAGEMAAAAALARFLGERRPDVEVVLSSVTAAGVEVARRLLPESTAFVLPLDLGPLARRVVRRVDPALLVLVELELWPNLVAAAWARGAGVAVANGRIGATTSARLRFPGARRFVGLDRVGLFAVQDDECRRRLCGLGVPAERVLVTGNLKVDAPQSAAPDRAAARLALGIEPAARVLVAGSTHGGEEALVGRAARALAEESPFPFWLIVAPRHAERLAQAEKDLQNAGLAPLRLTRLRAQGLARAAGGRAGATVVVVDTMGELAGLYAAADLAVVGGSLVPGIGGHNVFEPVLAGVPVLVGGHHRNVRSDVLFL
ncbi:MAG: hypothetical protein HY812_20070, partial [Planctomycetes bacterium]|nr:hypothetical protein [Planctomycetota bacterium]